MSGMTEGETGGHVVGAGGVKRMDARSKPAGMTEGGGMDSSRSGFYLVGVDLVWGGFILLVGI